MNRLAFLGYQLVLHAFALWGLMDVLARVGGREWPL